MTSDGPLLEVQGLHVEFAGDDGLVRAVAGADLTVQPGQMHCVVGESGCGKSQTARAVVQLLEPPGRLAGGSVRWRTTDGVTDLAALDPRGAAMRRVRGGEIGMIFQEPARSLSPLHTVGAQIAEALRLHRGLSRRDARREAVALLDEVRIPRPELRAAAYPFELSGGMRQRAMIAIALAGRPRLLIADEPTTALDVTTQAQILQLIRELQAERDMAVLFITHDLGVVADIADRVSVMYLGQVVESAGVYDLFDRPQHPYTRALLDSVPQVAARPAGAPRPRLATIAGHVPSPLDRPSGCAFRTRCAHAVDGLCDVTLPSERHLPVPAVRPPSGVPDRAHTVRCLRTDELAPAVAPTREVRPV